ncbi:uncharacterized protein FTJAE_9579 [Fusarium tjaetaba]|uniref:Uncharacterized protein n=1 Tax=Fusarium tjaetaba TaxID=1567544 RepID=A0A8H5R5Y5_9HYPO|nr:uncharacterized protein FTJAE_9579 [Fusarium tjaetaba]KAF5626722.1 hypothetical protein FTJAE_9579 [Fusarium tjaetaba]
MTRTCGLLTLKLRNQEQLHSHSRTYRHARSRLQLCRPNDMKATVKTKSNRLVERGYEFEVYDADTGAIYEDIADDRAIARTFRTGVSHLAVNGHTVALASRSPPRFPRDGTTQLVSIPTIFAPCVLFQSWKRTLPRAPMNVPQPLAFSPTPSTTNPKFTAMCGAPV